MPDWKQQRIAQETLDIYAPLAHRLGMQDLKQQLEDLAFATLHPKQYAEIDHMVAMRAPERDLYLAQVLEEVRDRLEELRIDAEVTGRPKHLWSIYEKMVVKGKGFDDIFDLVGIRVLVDSVKDCYAALGSIHATWKPVQGRFKDYIAQPKFNLYQSLHTTVIGPQGKPLEVQIRTQEMHQRAEFGVAAHWAYKELAGDDMAWLNRIVDWQSEISDPERFLEALKIDLEQDEVFVFTPKGRVITLARGATPIDFAYAIHTEVGHACVGAKVNGRLVSLDHQLESGDTCEIFTSRSRARARSRTGSRSSAPRGRPTRSASGSPGSGARTPARRAGTTSSGAAPRGAPGPEAAGQAARRGRRVAQLRRRRRAAHGHRRAPRVGRVGGRPGRQARCAAATRSRRSSSPPPPARPASRGTGHRSVGVHVEGLDDVMVRLSRCCTPVPGDEIMGFVTRGRGVSVHRADCANAESLKTGQGDRLIEVEWDELRGGTFVVAIELLALDRPRLLSDVASALAEHHVNILSCESRAGPDRVTKMRFDFELADPSHLDAVLRSLKRIDCVYEVYRVLPGKGGEAEKRR